MKLNIPEYTVYMTDREIYTIIFALKAVVLNDNNINYCQSYGIERFLTKCDSLIALKDLCATIDRMSLYNSIFDELKKKVENDGTNTE